MIVIIEGDHNHNHQVRKALLEVDVNLWKFYDQRILKNNVWPLVRNINHQHYHQSPSIIVTIIEICVLVLLVLISSS